MKKAPGGTKPARNPIRRDEYSIPYLKGLSRCEGKSEK